MNEKLKAHKLRGEKRGEMWEGRRQRLNPQNKNLPPIFENVAICMGCGKEKHVNAFGFCESCWVSFAHLRGGKIKNDKNNKSGV